MTDNSIFWICCTILIILFAGSPDIADGIIDNLMSVEVGE